MIPSVISLNIQDIDKIAKFKEYGFFKKLASSCPNLIQLFFMSPNYRLVLIDKMSVKQFFWFYYGKEFRLNYKRPLF